MYNYITKIKELSGLKRTILFQGKHMEFEFSNIINTLTINTRRRCVILYLDIIEVPLKI